MTYDLPVKRALPLLGKTTTPAGLVEAIQDTEWMTAYGNVTVEDDHGIFGPFKRVEIATGGWSVNEQLLSELEATTFHHYWWTTIHRGGKRVFEVPADKWDKPGQLLYVLGGRR